MGDALKKVKPGDPLAIPAAMFNTFVDAAKDYLSRQREQGQKATPAGRCGGIVLVRNDSGADPGRFEVLGVSTPLFTPTADLDAFKNTRALAGVTPTEADHLGKFVILLEPVAAGELALALASGVCPVKLSVTDEADDFADVNDGQCATLKTGPKGSAVILWKESGTGVKWGIVKLAGPAPMILWGVALEDWYYGNTVTLDPCCEDGTDNGQDNVTGHVICPREGDRGNPNYEAGTGLVICEGAGLEALDAATGRRVWRWAPPVELGGLNGAAALVGAATIAAPCRGGLCALNATVGRVAARQTWDDTGWGAHGPANCVAADGELYAVAAGRVRRSWVLTRARSSATEYGLTT